LAGCVKLASPRDSRLVGSQTIYVVPYTGETVAHPSWELAVSGAIPAIVAMWVVDRLDAKRPEPPRLRRLVVFVGMLSVVPAVFFELLVSHTLGEKVAPVLTYQGASFHAFAVAAFIEEACKIAVIYWVVWRRPEFDERMDGIVYASRAGLGFALVENVMYLLNETTLNGQLQLWAMRAVLAVPGHAMWTGMIGAMAARRRFDGRGLGLIGGYLLAVAFNGTYDLCVFLQVPLHFEGHDDLARLIMPALIGLTVVAFLTLRAMARTALRLDDADAALTAAAAARPVATLGGS
jgi:RsiW-degrading membrane proteinase PrsW (M82 family)